MFFNFKGHLQDIEGKVQTQQSRPKAALRRLPSTLLRAAVSQGRNDPDGGYCEGRQCRDGKFHGITSFRC